MFFPEPSNLSDYPYLFVDLLFFLLKMHSEWYGTQNMAWEMVTAG